MFRMIESMKIHLVILFAGVVCLALLAIEVVPRVMEVRDIFLAAF